MDLHTCFVCICLGNSDDSLLQILASYLETHVLVSFLLEFW